MDHPHRFNLQHKHSLELNSRSIIQHNQTNEKMEFLNSIRNVLNKTPESRANTQNKILNRFVKYSSFFTALHELSSFDTAKNILKNARIFDITKHRTIVQKGTDIENLILLINGKFGIVETNETTNQNTQFYKQDRQLMKKILENSIKITRNLKRKIKQTPASPQKETQFKTNRAEMMDIKFKSVIEDEQQMFNLPALVECNKYHQTLTTLNICTILVINAKLFYENLANYIKQTKADKIKYFRKFEEFNQIEDQKLVQFVDQLSVKNLKKGQFIYKEGEEAANIYLLINGSIKITKTVNLFRQNPNMFYMDREKLCPGNKLSFVDFTKVYNYKPRTKLLQIGTKNQISIFGECQIFSQSKIRHANAEVSSQNATLYIIPLKKLHNDFSYIKNFQSHFRNILFENQTKKKILYRQQKLSQLLMLENKCNMDYFFIEEAKEIVHSQYSPRKYKLNKINAFISPQAEKQENMSPIKDAKYHTFNFNKFSTSLTARRKSSPKILNFNQEETKILQLVHTFHIKPKEINENSAVTNQSQGSTQKMKHLKRYSIDINNPLIQLDYFNKSRKQSSKLNKQSRSRPVSALTRRTKSRPHSVMSVRNTSTYTIN